MPTLNGDGGLPAFYHAPTPQRSYLPNDALDYDHRPEANIPAISRMNGITPTGDYTWRAPSPPHIHVPQTPDDHEYVLPEFNAFGYTDEDKEILRTVASAHHVAVGVKNWKYEYRRKAQPILTYLFLGPSAAIRDIETLRNDGITMLLVIRNNMTAMASLLSGQKVAQQLGIQAAAIDVGGNADLIASFPRAIKTINDHLISHYRQHISNGNPDRAFGKVLVFCESGNERSAAVVAAFLMNTYGLDLVAALQYIQAQRFCVAFDDPLKNLLLSYQDILNAQKSLSGTIPAQQLLIHGPKTAAKRRREDIEDDAMEVDMDRGDDQERFGGRTVFIPFSDNRMA